MKEWNSGWYGFHNKYSKMGGSGAQCYTLKFRWQIFYFDYDIYLSFDPSEHIAVDADDLFESTELYVDEVNTLNERLKKTMSLEWQKVDDILGIAEEIMHHYYKYWYFNELNELHAYALYATFNTTHRVDEVLQYLINLSRVQKDKLHEENEWFEMYLELEAYTISNKGKLLDAEKCE